MQWLTEAGAISKERITHTQNRAWLAFDASTAEIEQLLHTEYHEHEHEASGRSMISCDQYHIPAYLQEHIDYITPGTKGIHVSSSELRKRQWGSGHHGTGGPTWGNPFGWRPPHQHGPPPSMPWHPHNPLATCDIAITPVCLQALYHFLPQDPNAEVSPNNSMGIFEEGDYYSQKDLNLFFTNFTSYIPNGTHPILDSIDGGEAPVPTKQAGGESDLDFELSIPIIYPQTTTLYQTDDKYYAEGGSKTATGILNTFFDGKLPLTIFCRSREGRGFEIEANCNK